MLCYWILRLPDGSPAGLLRVQNDRVRLSLSAPVEGRFTLFSDTASVPIVPESETVLPCPKALLGTDGDRVTCFAAAENAEPLAVYRKRMSSLCTMKDSEQDVLPVSDSPIPILSHTDAVKPDPSADLSDHSDHMSRFSTTKANSISDSARDAQIFSLLLQRAESFYTAYEVDQTDDMVQNKDMYIEDRDGIDLFHREFPGARWRYVDGTDVLPHYEGTWKQPNGPTLHILAVQGRAAPRPPRALFGFTRFLRDRDGTGYWLRLTPLP